MDNFPHSTNHYPISSLERNRNGSLLKRIGIPSALPKWSPNNQRLFTSTVGSVFRVWQTNKWTPERWIIPSGSIQLAACSTCSNHLLFVITNETILYSLYSLCFLEEQLYRGMNDLNNYQN